MTQDVTTDASVRLRDGRRISYSVTGTSGPLIVLECGLGAPAASWVTVRRLLARDFRVLSYDRAGLGGSDRDPAPRTLRRITDDLIELLDAVGVDEPATFVGHSWGGPIVRLLADREPHRVAGAVLVDPTVAELRPNLRTARPGFLFLSCVVRLGQRELLLKKLRTAWTEIPEDEVERGLRDYLTPANLRTARQEVREVMRSLPALAELESRGLTVPARWLIGVEKPARLRDLHLGACDRVALRDVSRDIVQVDCGHFVPQERPHRTATEIADFVSSVPAS